MTKSWLNTRSILALAMMGVSPPARADNVRPTIIPLEYYTDSHWGFRAHIGGRRELVVFDTGGGLTMISPEVAARIGCSPWGRLTGFRMRGDRLDVSRCENVSMVVGGRAVRLATTGVWDFNHLLPKDVEPIAANVGLDAFPGRAVTLDIAHRRLILETPASLKRRVAHAFQTSVHLLDEAEGYSHTVMVGLNTVHGPIWLGIDSGDDVPITIAKHVAETVGLDPGKKEMQPFCALLKGGMPLSGTAMVRDMIYDGNIGAPILAHWVVTIDLASHRLWLAPARSAPHDVSSAHADGGNPVQ